MKSWCDLSWREKCKIRDGDAPRFKYLTGYAFQVKMKVIEGRKNKERRETS